jgi:uncharacterized protein
MEALIIKSQKKIATAPTEFKRYLLSRMNLNQRFISVRGARGTGKTTMLLQIGASQSEKKILYLALDDLFFTQNSLYSLAERFSRTGGELLLLDEVHKYPNWSRELKLIYDDIPDLQVIFTSSSLLDIFKGESDLSRRVSSYNLHEMSFREYLEFQHGIKFPVVSFEKLVTDNEKIALQYTNNFKPFQYFEDYLRHGAYPFYSGDEFDYHQKLLNTVNLVLDIDLPAVEGIEYSHVAKFKKLLFVLSENVPFTPNISKLSERINLNRNTLVQAIQMLENAELLHTLYKKTRSVSVLNKPDKIWLHNTNLSFAISNSEPDKGNLRESFFLSQVFVDHNAALPGNGDFLINEKYLFEVGGKNKTSKQIAGHENAFLVKDDIEIGTDKSIPLWLVGFLY